MSNLPQPPVAALECEVQYDPYKERGAKNGRAYLIVIFDHLALADSLASVKVDAN